MHELELRISDVDRDRAASALNKAVGEGRISWDEHGERLAAVYDARTGADLVPLLADLPGIDLPRSNPSRAVPATTSMGPEAPMLQVTLGKVRRRPDPAAGIQRVEVTLGAAVIDLRDLPAGCLIDVVANSTLGKVEVWLSPGTSLIDEGTAWLGKRSTVESRRNAPRLPARPGAPVVRLSGHSVLGHVRVTIG